MIVWLRNQKPGALLQPLRTATKLPRAARPVAEALAGVELRGIAYAEGGVAAEILLALAENNCQISAVAQKLRPPLLQRLPLPDLVSIVAALGEQGLKDDLLRPPLQAKVAVAGPGLALVPPSRLLRLATASQSSSCIAQTALGPVAGAAAQSLESWTAEDVSELMLLVATSGGAENSPGAKRLFSRVTEVLTPRLSALSATVLLKVVVAAGAAAAHCRDLLEAAANRADVCSEYAVHSSIVREHGFLLRVSQSRRSAAIFQVMLARPRPRPNAPPEAVSVSGGPTKPRAAGSPLPKHALFGQTGRKEKKVPLDKEMLETILQEVRGLTDDELYEQLSTWQDNPELLVRRQQTELQLHSEVEKLQEEVQHHRQGCAAAQQLALDAQVSHAEATRRSEFQLGLVKRQLQSIKRGTTAASGLAQRCRDCQRKAELFDLEREALQKEGAMKKKAWQ
eukprot:symbB.v1.2.016317.t1/scaffold1148.1/size135353/7